MKELLLEIKRKVDNSGGVLDESLAAKYEESYYDVLALADSENPIDNDFIVRSHRRGRKKRSKVRNLIDRLKLISRRCCFLCGTQEFPLTITWQNGISAWQNCSLRYPVDFDQIRGLIRSAV